MAILIVRDAKVWLAEMLGRSGSISQPTWEALLEQGMPIGEVGASPIVSTEAVEEWLQRRAVVRTRQENGREANPPSDDQSVPKKRGRPRKYRQGL